METQQVTGFESKVKQLIDRYKNLHQKFENEVLERENLELLKMELEETCQLNSSKIEELESNISQKNDELTSLRDRCAELQAKLSSMEDTKRLAASRIDDVLAQINEL